MLTGVQGTIKMDSGEEIKLSVSTEGSQGSGLMPKTCPQDLNLP